MPQLLEVVDITTEDGVGINGAYWTPDPGTMAKGVDAWLLLPGQSGAFYSQVQRPFAQALVKHGYPALTLSTRGHDTMWISRPSGRVMGIANEFVSEGHYDIKAALDVLESKGHKNIGLLGHSLGSVKSFYFFAHHSDPRIKVFASVSGPRVARSAWSTRPGAEKMEAALENAKKLVAEGKGDIVGLHSTTQGEMYRTPKSLIDWNDDDKYDILQNAAKVTVPLIALRGSEEPQIMPDGWLEQVIEAATQASPKTQTTIAGADHFFSAATAPVAIAAIAEFTEKLA